MLNQAQIAFYRDNGYLKVENVIEKSLLKALRRITDDFITNSRSLTASDAVYDIEDGHGPDTPRLSRIKLPHKQHALFAELLRHPKLLQCFQCLLGANVVLQTTKLNMKAGGGGTAIEWHQDWAFYPHTNDDMLALGLMLDDVDHDNGPLMVIPASHKSSILSHHRQGVFCGAIDPDDPNFHLEKAVTLTGKAGDVTIHHVRTLHGSAANTSNRTRMMMFFEVCAADAWPLAGSGAYMYSLPQEEFWKDLQSRVLCGKAILEPRYEKIPARLPLPPAPDASSIFKTQKSGGAKSAFAA